MAKLEIRSVNDNCFDADYETDFSDNDNGDWDQIELVENEDNLITYESRQSAESIIKAYRRECWQCSKCNTINNVRECIKLHGSKCVGCQDECYIEFQTETIDQIEYHADNEYYLLQIGELWQCESCLTINDKSIGKCKECDKPSARTILRRKIKKLTKKEKRERLIYGFVREQKYYIKMPDIPGVLFKLISNFYVIDYLEEGWVIGNIKCMSILKASSLKIGDKLDYKNKAGKFKFAEVTEVDTSSDKCKFRLKYEGSTNTSTSFTWTSTTGTTTTFTFGSYAWCDYNKHPLKFAEAGAVSARPAHRLCDVKVGDKVDINPIYGANKSHFGWKTGEIKEMDDKSGQVKVGYKYNDTDQTHWTHLDNEDEIAEYGSMTGKTGMTMSDLLKDDIEKQERAKMNLRDEW